jgi:hypothetical protein
MKGTTLNGMMKNIVKMMNAISSGNYTSIINIIAYCLINVAFISKVKSS